MRAMEYLGIDPDADLLNGQPASFYQDASNLISGIISDARLPDTITSNITGNAATTTKLLNARTITLTGDASGSTSFDGSANVNITVDISGVLLTGEAIV